MEKKQDYFKIQYDRLNKFLSKTRLKNLESLAVGETQEVQKELMPYLEKLRANRNQIISTQFKHALYDDGNIYFNPELKNLLDKHVGEEKYTNKDNGFHLVDHLNPSWYITKSKGRQNKSCKGREVRYQALQI